MQPRVQEVFELPFGKTIIWLLQDFYTDMRHRRYDKWVPDIYFDRGEGKHNPTQKDADNVIIVLGDEIDYEMAVWEDSHFWATGATETPKWFELSTPDTRLSLVQKIYRLIDATPVNQAVRDPSLDADYYYKNGGTVWRHIAEENEHLERDVG